MRTRDNDPVISLHLSESFLILGDVNGELHRIEVLFVSNNILLWSETPYWLTYTLLFGVEKAWTQVHNLNQFSENLCPKRFRPIWSFSKGFTSEK